MRVRIEPLTLERARERGASPEEIKDVVENGLSVPARGNRRARAKIFPFKQERVGRFYDQKRIEVIYVEEADTIVTITVHVFYGEWKV